MADLKHGGPSHLGIAVPDVHRFAERLREQGIELAIPITEFVSGVPVTFIRDPEGNLIEIFPEALRRPQVAPNAPAHLGEEKRGRTDDEQSR
jgi:hypothetical protein